MSTSNQSRPPLRIAVLYADRLDSDADREEAFAALRAAVPNVEIRVAPYVAAAGEPSDEVRHALADAEAVLAFELPPHLDRLAPRLRWIQLVSSGHDHVDVPALARHGIALTSAAGASATAVAEFVLARLLQVRKGLRHLDAQQRDRRWSPVYAPELAGTTAGLIGLGAINRAVATRLRAFGVRLLALSRAAPPAGTSTLVDEHHDIGDLRRILPECDFVVAAVPHAPETVGMFDAAAFAAMAGHAVFCNVGRGSLVDEDALVDALERGVIAAAVLDVVAQEPLPFESKLWAAPNLYLSPHCATSPPALLRRAHERFRTNAVRYVDGQPLEGVVEG